MRKYWMTALAVALGALLGGALLATPASATPAQEGPITVVQSDCADGGEVTIKISGVEYNVSSGVKTAGLAARVDGVVFANTQVEKHDGTYDADEELVIGPFDVDTTVEYRWFAGPIRNDLPAWNLDHPELNEIIDEVEQPDENGVPTNRHWDARDDAPFVTWYEFDAKGCPTNEDDDTDTDADDNSDTNGDDGSADDIDDAGSADDIDDKASESTSDEQLPVTGASLPYIMGAGAAFLGLGAGIVLLTRKRKQHFITE